MAGMLVSHDATATIGSGQTTSNAIEGRHYGAWLAVMPAAFTGTQVSFTASVDGTTYQTLKTTTGTTVAVDVTASISVPLPPEVGHARWFKLVSNAAEGAARTIRLIGKGVASAPVRAAAGGGGAGTEYTEGDTDGSITGGAILWEDTGDTLRAVSAAKPLPVNLVSGSSAGTEYVEDAAAPANPSAGALSLRRRDTLSGAEVSADLDWVTANATAKGELYVKQTDAVPVTDNGGSLTVDGTVAVSNMVAAATQFAEDSPHANGDLGTLVFGVRKDVRASNVGTDGDYAPFQVNAQGDIRVDGSAVTQPVSGTFWQATQPVSGTFWQATQPVSGTVAVSNLPAVQPVSDNGSSLTVDETGSAASVATVDATDAAATLAASSATRRGLLVRNESPDPLYLKYGSGADWQSSFTDVVAPMTAWSMRAPIYTGVVSGVWKPKNPAVPRSSGGVSGTAYVTDVSV